MDMQEKRVKFDREKPQLITVMGVSGSGKSTLAQSLASRLALAYMDADDFHGDDAKSKMSKGIPLNDDDRAPWIRRLCVALIQHYHTGGHAVLAFSGLKKDYRDSIRDTGYEVSTIFMAGDAALIFERMTLRTQHFMPAGLLQSQMDTLEPPGDDENVLRLDIAESPELQLQKALEFLR